ncbi:MULTISPECIES: Crp/Fnr family transcriptional regulator [unclassified Streptomyces]|uniref:Crp/Fnr family transcriptional regulator n=1 Tax=unclassified Streptomyces TaxID=2593676 RepID=UPI002E2C45BB|nr:Crp/Fnr family transcriptional regulator [Streptomyces sp. NBC_01439]
MPPNVEAFHTTDVLMGRQPMPPGSFLGNLSAAAWPHFVHTWGPDARTYQRGEELPLGPGNQHVYIVMGGCVIQERFPLGRGHRAPKVSRFRGVGQVVGEAKLIDPSSSVTTWCLSTTWVMPCDARRLHVLLKQSREVEDALLLSLEARNRSDELIYSTADRSPVQRVGTLLAHLAVVAGAKDPNDPERITITGLSQTNIADALLLGKSTVEKAVAQLREYQVVACKYRQLMVTDMRRLQGVAAS